MYLDGVYYWYGENKEKSDGKSGIWHGPYKVLGDPHPGDPTQTSFRSQISSVFKVQGKEDLYIAVADRWCPQEMDVPYEFSRDLFTCIFSGRTDEIPSLIGKYGIVPPAQDQERNTAIAGYVWLPFRFDGEMAYLDWQDEWRIEDYK